MKKKMIWVILTLLIATIVVGLNANLIAPKKINSRFETLSSPLIPEKLNGVSIVFFTDVHFNAFVDEVRFSNVIDKINQLHPDIVIFGGDLVDYTNQASLTAEQKKFLTSQLSSINSHLGKYAVYGDQDLVSTTAKADYDQIMYDSNFEVLSNQSIKVRLRDSEFINLVGIDALHSGNPNIDLAFSNISPSNYTLAFCHTPDIFDTLPNDSANYLLSGHSHGGQIYFPIIGGMYRPLGADTYSRGKHTHNQLTLDISNGVGTINHDSRLFAGAEIVHYTLRHQPIDDTKLDEE